MTPAQIIWKQIPVMTKMACGARKPTTNGDNELTFKVGGKPLRFIRVEYTPDDLYNVTHFRVKRNDYTQVVLEEANGIYADQLGEVIYNQVNK